MYLDLGTNGQVEQTDRWKIKKKHIAFSELPCHESPENIFKHIAKKKIFFRPKTI